MKLLPLLFFAVLAFLPAQLQARDNKDPYGYCPGGGGCDPDQPGYNDQSLYCRIPIGVAHTFRPASLLSANRLGAIEGEIFNRQRSFQDLFRASYKQNAISRNQVNLEFEVDRIDQRLYHPSVLKLFSSAVFDRIDNTSTTTPFIEQVLTDTTLTNIELLGSGQTGFRMRLWRAHEFTPTKLGGLYEIPKNQSNPTQDLDPYLEMIFKKPAGLAGDHELIITQTERFGMGSPHTTTTHRSHNRTTDVLTIRTYQGSDITGTLLREQVIQYNRGSLRGNRTWDYHLTRTVREASVQNGVIGALADIARTQEFFEDYSPADDLDGGEAGRRRLVKMVRDFGGKNLTTTYEHIDEPGNRYLHGRPYRTIRPDGSWEVHQYLDNENSPAVVHTMYSSWKDVPITSFQNGLAEEVTVTKDSMEKITTIGGQQIAGERLKIRLAPDGKTILTEDEWTGAEWASTITCYHQETASRGQRGRMAWKEHADGTATIYSYGYFGDVFRITMETGAGDRNGITDGVKTTREYNESYQLISELKFDIPQTNLSLGSKIATNDSSIDKLGRPSKWMLNLYSNDIIEREYSCCGLGFVRERNGATITYFRDPLKRVYKTVTKRSSGGPEFTTIFNINGLTTETRISSSAGDLLVSEVTKTLSELQTTTLSPDADGDGNPESLTRIMTYPSGGGSSATFTYPDGTTSITTTFFDGRTKTRADQEGNTITYDINTHSLQGGGLVSRMTQPGGTQWMESYQDQMGRIFRIAYPDGSYATRSYHSFRTAPKGSRGKLASQNDADENAVPGSGSSVTYTYSADGDDVTMTEALPGGQSRITKNLQKTVASVSLHGVTIAPALSRETEVNGVLISQSFSSIDGYLSGSISFGREVLSETTLPVDGAWATTSTNADGSFSVRNHTDGLMKASFSFASGELLPDPLPADVTTYSAPGFIAGNSRTHDAFGRILTSTDARRGTSTMGSYLESGALTGVTEPGNRITTFTYDVMGRRVTVDAPDSFDEQGSPLANITHTSYTPRGQIKASWGDQTYPRAYEYDSQGRMVFLHTWQAAPIAEPQLPGEAVTEWKYDAQRGWLIEKNYHGETGNGPGNAADYTYTSSGRLASRTWERGVVATYGYDQSQLSSVIYSNETNGHTTPNLAYTYDNFGRLDQVLRGGSLHADYDYRADNLLLETEHLNQDTAVPLSLNRYYDQILRPKSLEIPSKYTTAYGYDPAGRLQNVWHNPTLNANKEPQGSAAFTYSYLPQSGNLIEQLTGPVHAVTNTWEVTRNVLDKKENKVGTSLISSYDYEVNDIGQRISVTQGGTALSGSPTIAWSYNHRGELVQADHASATQDRAYQYDAIGNRKKDANGSPILPSNDNYQINLLNQYTATPHALMPSYDADGNQLQGTVPGTSSASLGSSTNATNMTWDAENRLVAIATDSVATSYSYDYLSRRITRERGNFIHNYHYDGWNQITFHSSSGTVGNLGTNYIRSYTWGQDLSGTMQGAGGVGGMLATHFRSGANRDNFPLYDGNGNIGQYLTNSGATVAQYEYDPFGRTTIKTGSRADTLRYRFSTKFRDFNTGLYYYGYRYYNPVTGRWPSRDPIGINFPDEINLYAFISNEIISAVDYLGLSKKDSDINREASNACRDANKCTQKDPKKHERCGLICCKDDIIKKTPHTTGRTIVTRHRDGSVSKAPKCNPFEKGDCSKQIGKGWKTVGWYHSQPTSNFFSEGDFDFGKEHPKIPGFVAGGDSDDVFRIDIRDGVNSTPYGDNDVTVGCVCQVNPDGSTSDPNRSVFPRDLPGVNKPKKLN